MNGRSEQGRTGYLNEASTTQTASSLSAGGGLVLMAGRDPTQAVGTEGQLAVSGSNLKAQGDILVQGTQVSITAAKAAQSMDLQTVASGAAS